MTIKQVLIGTVLGTSIVGLMVHRLHKVQEARAQVKMASTKIMVRKEHTHKTAMLYKTHHSRKQHPKNTEPQLSSRKLYS